MAKDTDDVADLLEPTSGKSSARPIGKGTVSTKGSSQDADSGIEAKDYVYDDAGFDIKTTTDRAMELAQQAVEQAKGDGSDDGIGHQELDY